MSASSPTPPTPSTPPTSRRSGLERVNELLRERLFGHSPHIGVIRIGEDLIHYVVALVLLAVAGIVLYHTAYDLATSRGPFAAAATSAVNGVLFAIIVIEVMRTVIALTVGARLSLSGSTSEPSSAVLHPRCWSSPSTPRWSSAWRHRWC